MCCRESTSRLELFTAVQVFQWSTGLWVSQPGLLWLLSTILSSTGWKAVISCFCLRSAKIFVWNLHYPISRNSLLPFPIKKETVYSSNHSQTLKGKKSSALSMQSDSCFLERQWDLNSSSFFKRIKVKLISSRINFTKSMWKDIYFLSNSSKIYKHIRIIINQEWDWIFFLAIT